jgi:hypothetical protein
MACIKIQSPPRQLAAAIPPSLSSETTRHLPCYILSNRLFWNVGSNYRGISMKATQKILKSRILINGFAISSLALGICVSSLPAAAQGQPSQNAVTIQQADGQPAPDTTPQYSASANQSVPPAIILPAGTVIPVRVTEWLSSDRNQSGDRFSASLEQPLVANGWVVASRGQMVTGRVTLAKKAGHGDKVSQLGVELSELTLVDGQVLPVRTQLLQSSAGTSNGRDAATIATTTGIGTIVGGAAGGGEGAMIGAGVGVAAGIIGVLSTPGKPTVIPPETLLTFRLEVPLSISTERGQVAFQPVRPADYRGDQDAYANPPRQRFVTGPPYSRPYYYYPGPWYGYGYPGLYFGYYGFYGPRFGRGFRGGFRR